MLACFSGGVIDDSRTGGLFDACQQNPHRHPRVRSSKLHLAGVPDHSGGRLPLDVGLEVTVRPATRARVVLRRAGYEFLSVESIAGELVISQVNDPQVARAYDAPQATAAQIGMLYGRIGPPGIVKRGLQQCTDWVLREIDVGNHLTSGGEQRCEPTVAAPSRVEHLVMTRHVEPLCTRLDDMGPQCPGSIRMQNPAASRVGAGHSASWAARRSAAAYTRSGLVSMTSAAISPDKPALASAIQRQIPQPFIPASRNIDTTGVQSSRTSSASSSNAAGTCFSPLTATVKRAPRSQARRTSW